MIASTYADVGRAAHAERLPLRAGPADRATQTIAWMVIFFFASAAASSAYLTVSETLPLEIRALAIAVFYAFGTALGGIIGPALFGGLIDTHQRGAVFAGYLVGSAADDRGRDRGGDLGCGRGAQVARARWRGRFRRWRTTNDPPTFRAR